MKDHVPCSFHCCLFAVFAVSDTFASSPNRGFWPATRSSPVLASHWQASPVRLTGVYSRLQHAHAMNIYLAWTGTILYWISWPIGIVLFYLFVTVVAILKLIYWPIAFVLQPVVYLLRFIAACLALPFRALVKLEVSRRSVVYSMHVSDCLFLASVQLHRRCGTTRPDRWTGHILHLQHPPSDSSSRFDARTSQRTHFQAVPPGESTAESKITAPYHAITRQCHHQPHQWLRQHRRHR